MKKFLILTLIAFISVLCISATYHFKQVNTLTLTASNKTAQKGAEVCLDISSKDFQQIVSMQYTMKWNPKVIKYKSVKGFGLPGMSANSFGAQDAANGKLTFSWFDFNVRGITVADGTALYQVCFDAIGESGTKGYFQFTNSPTVIEIANVFDVFLELNAVNGLVRIR